MRLLNTSSLELEQFVAANIPPYAILSHTWGEEEVTHQDVEGRKAVRKRGYEKVQKYCATAKAGGFSHVWIDTCCIDKTSSAELPRQ